MSLGFAAMFLENYDEAPPYVMESLAIYRELGYREGVAEALEALALTSPPLSGDPTTFFAAGP